MKKFKLRLNFFGEGEGASAVAEGSEAGSTELATPSAEGDIANPAGTEDLETEYKELIKGKYKEVADKHIQGVLNKRFKNAKENDARMQRMESILGAIAPKYNLDGSDLDALEQAIGNDDSIYEERAMEEGLTVDQYKRIAQAEAKNRQYEAQLQAQQREDFKNQKIAEWQAQAEALKQNFPEFDLNDELQNETFQQLLRNGVNMESAYYAIHGAQLMHDAMGYTADAVRKATVDEISSRGMRPRENASSRQASATVRTDVSKLTRADREALSRRALSGEIINL